MAKKLVTSSSLGYDVRYSSDDKYLYINIDNDTLIRDGSDNTIKVDVDALGIKVVSDYNGNVLSLGSDTGAVLTSGAIKKVVAEMFASATDGLDVDEVTKAVTAYLVNMGVTDSNSIDLTFTNTAGTGNIKADLKVDNISGNRLVVTDSGVKVPEATVSLNVDKTTNAEKLEVVVDGISKKVDLELVTDLNEENGFFVIKKV